MAYIGREPQVGNFQVCDAISVVDGQAAYTMQVSSVNVSPETANHMLVSLNGVLQAPGSSYTVSGSTITFASNLVTGDVINFIHILGSVLDLGTPSDDTVATSSLKANSVTAAKLNADIISGTTALASEPADTDEFLVSDAGVLKRIDYSLIKGGGSWNLISTTTISSDSDVTISGMDSTYKNYAMILTNIHPATNNVTLNGQAIISGSAYTTSNYYSINEHSRTGNAGCEYDNQEGQSEWSLNHSGQNMGNANHDNMNMIINIPNPSNTTFEKIIDVKSNYNHNAVSNMFSRCYGISAIQTITSAFTGIKFFFSSGNMDSGTIKLYGIS